MFGEASVSGCVNATLSTCLKTLHSCGTVTSANNLQRKATLKPVFDEADEENVVSCLLHPVK